MQTQPHLSKRGDVYQWRRKSRRFSTETIDIKLSLGTTDRNRALILARKVSAESDQIMEHIVENRITPERGRAFLAAVIRTERAKIDQLKLLARIDSLTPEDDARHDAAMAEAWGRIAQNGVNHTPAPDSDALVQDNIDLIQRDLGSHPRRKAITNAYRDLSGKENLSAMEFAQVLDLYVSGKAKAWADKEDGADAATQMEPTLAQAEPAVAQELPVAAQIETAAPHPDPTLPSPKLLDVVDRMNAIKRTEGIEEKTLRQYQSFAALFIMLTGIDDITRIRQPDVKAFRADLAKMPKSWGKSPKDQTTNREDVMAKSASLPADKVGLSVGTVNRHLEHLNQIAEWARDEGLAVDANLKPSRLRKRDTVRARDKRDAFTLDQLHRVFRNPVWTGSRSEYHQTNPGHTIYKNGIYWCPLIGAFTGARREEIAGLAPADVIQKDGIWCFAIEDSELRRVKNLSSHRVVPIHSQLIGLGFLDHVQKARDSEQRGLFPELYEPGNNAFGRKVGRRMRQVIDQELGAEGSNLSFHSLRHYVQNELDYAGVDDRLVRDIVGHEGIDIHDKVYRKAAPIRTLANAVARLPETMLS